MIRCEKEKNLMDATVNSEERFVTWRMFMSSTLQASAFMGKNFSDKWHSLKNSKDFTIKQMFDTLEKLISEKLNEIYGSENN